MAAASTLSEQSDSRNFYSSTAMKHQFAIMNNAGSRHSFKHPPCPTLGPPTGSRHACASSVPVSGEPIVLSGFGRTHPWPGQNTGQWHSAGPETDLVGGPFVHARHA